MDKAVYLIYFDDAEVKPEIVIGEDAARRRFEQVSQQWNAHLFGKVVSNSHDDRHAADNAPQPPSASDERERYVKWLSETFPGIYSVEEASRWWSQEHISALAWEARAALSPSPGVDAAEQKPIYQVKLYNDAAPTWHDATEKAYDMHPPTERRIVYAAPSPAASADEWMAEAERLVAANEQAYCDASLRGTEPYWSIARASRLALLAHLKARP